MKSKRLALLLSCLILTIGSTACTTIEVAAPLPCPERPVLMVIPEDLQLQMPQDAVLITAENQLKLKAYAKKLEARASCD